MRPLLRVSSQLTCGLAYQALVVEGGMKKGDNVLIHAVSSLLLIHRPYHVADRAQGASGVGVAAIQLACECYKIPARR